MASIEKRPRQDGRASWRAHYRTPSGEQRNKTFDRKAALRRRSARAASTVGHRALRTGSTTRPTSSRQPTSGMRGSSASTSDPKWDPVKFANVSHADVQKWVTALSKARSPATVRKVHRVLSLISNMAVKDGRLARNVEVSDRQGGVWPSQRGLKVLRLARSTTRRNAPGRNRRLF